MVMAGSFLQLSNSGLLCKTLARRQGTGRAVLWVWFQFNSIFQFTQSNTIFYSFYWQYESVIVYTMDVTLRYKFCYNSIICAAKRLYHSSDASLYFKMPYISYMLIKKFKVKRTGRAGERIVCLFFKALCLSHCTIARKIFEFAVSRNLMQIAKEQSLTLAVCGL